jgi:heptosyltransferase-2
MMYQKILIRMPNWIGDAVMALPAVSALRRRFPDAELVAVAIPVIAELLSHHPAFDRLIVFDKRGLLGRLRLVRTVRAGRFDLAVLFSNAFESALVAALSGIPERLGYRRDGRGFLLNRGVPVPKETVHQSAYYLRLVEGLGTNGRHSPKTPSLWLLPDERAFASNLLIPKPFNSKLETGNPKLLVGVNPGAAYGSSKRWAPENFAEVANRLIASHDAAILIFGGPNDREAAEAIASAMKRPPLILAGKTSLRESMALLARCRLLITNDSGPMHIAAALGVPVVAVFGPTDPEVTSPLGEGHRIVRVDVDCSPCRHRECPIDHRCMVRLTPERVVEAAAETLLGPPNRGLPAVFLDRDGTINRDTGYVSRPEQFELIPGVARAIGRLNRAKIPVVVVTNQSGIERGFYSRDDLEQIHRRLVALLAAEGAHVDAIYFCPHAPDRRFCRCRKPAAGMLLRAVEDFSAARIDLSRSYVVGDKELDLFLGKAAGGRSILVRTGYGKETEAKLAALNLLETPVAEDLSGAVDLILTHHPSPMTHHS